MPSPPITLNVSIVAVIVSGLITLVGNSATAQGRRRRADYERRPQIPGQPQLFQSSARSQVFFGQDPAQPLGVRRISIIHHHCC